MRNKLKKIWNKEDGFTLVELLGVIVILGLIIAIAVPALGNILTNAKTNTDKATEALVLDAAKIYELDNPELSIHNKTDTFLFEEGYLDADPKGTYTIVKGDNGVLDATFSE